MDFDESIEERAAIMQYDGGLPRQEAELEAQIRALYDKAELHKQMGGGQTNESTYRAHDKIVRELNAEAAKLKQILEAIRK